MFFLILVTYALKLSIIRINKLHLVNSFSTYNAYLFVDKFNVKSIKAKLAQHRSLFKELASSKSKGVGNKTDSTKKLSYYSPWLEHFSDNEVNLNLEIPGQYKGDKMPLLKHHVKICGFSSEVR